MDWRIEDCEKYMKKIAVVIDNLELGGAQTMVSRLVSNLDRDKFNIKVFVLRNNINKEIEKEFYSKGINFTIVDIGQDTTIGKKLYAFRVIVKILNEFSPEIIHAHLDFLYAPLYCLFSSVKLIITIHGWPDRVINNRFKMLVNNPIVNKKVILVGCAKVVANRLKYMFPKVNVCSIYNPIDIHQYKLLKEDKREKFTYIHVARLSKIKNQELLINAFNDVLYIYPHSQLVIVGEGELKKDLLERVKQLGKEKQILFLGSRYDIPELLNKADVFVLSSTSECCPMSVLEAMASGLPIISTNVGGVREIIGESGICVENGNVIELRNAMIRMQEDKVLFDHCRAQATIRIKKFDSAIIADEYSELYEG